MPESFCLFHKSINQSCVFLGQWLLQWQGFIFALKPQGPFMAECQVHRSPRQRASGPRKSLSSLLADSRIWSFSDAKLGKLIFFSEKHAISFNWFFKFWRLFRKCEHVTRKARFEEFQNKTENWREWVSRKIYLICCEMKSSNLQKHPCNDSKSTQHLRSLILYQDTSLSLKSSKMTVSHLLSI